MNYNEGVSGDLCNISSQGTNQCANVGLGRTREAAETREEVIREGSDEAVVREDSVTWLHYNTSTCTHT